MTQQKHISKDKCALFPKNYNQCLSTVKYNDVEAIQCKWLINSWNTCNLLNKKQQATYINKLPI